MKMTSLQNSILIWVTLFTLALSACTSGSEDIPTTTPDNSSSTTNDGIFKLKASIIGYDANISGRCALNGISLFVFDQNDRFFDRLEVDIKSILENCEITISCPGSDQITVIAWGGSSDLSEMISKLKKGSSMDEFMFSANRSATTSLPGDIFYGQVVISGHNSRTLNVSNELVMKRKISSISLVTKGLAKKTSDNYTYRIKSANNGFNYKGEIVKGNIEYVIPAFFDEKGMLKMERTPVLPSSAITIELYNNNNLVFSAQKDENQNQLAAIEGNEALFLLEYNLSVNVKTNILPWAYASQDVDL